jgi:phosphoribulokinase
VYLHKPGLKAQLDVLAQDGEHPCVVVSNPLLQQVVDVRVGLELPELRHVPNIIWFRKIVIEGGKFKWKHEETEMSRKYACSKFL